MIRPRVQWIDVSRGIAIILVVLGHCISNMEEPGNRFILAFHMPLFFFISGLLCDGGADGFGVYFKKKFRTLLIPQITFGTINCGYEMLFRGKTLLSDWFLGWFLLVLFYVSILFYVLQRTLNMESRCTRYKVLIVALLAINMVKISGITTKLHFDIIPMALLFYLLGYHCRFWVGRNNECKNKGLWVVSIPVVVICSCWNKPVAMYLNSYGNLFIFFVGAFSGIIMVCGLSRNLQNNRFLAWFGRNSIIIYILHFKIIDAVHSVGNRALPEIFKLTNSYPVYWYNFVIVILLIVPIVYICERHLGMIFGKRQI